QAANKLPGPSSTASSTEKHPRYKDLTKLSWTLVMEPGCKGHCSSSNTNLDLDVVSTGTVTALI
ncbi:MAG TPA: hypothetical protein VGO47_02090, partial [Chlamydiales bacterium]|nr:hypothetical protein [Chlamydiales bacterium]